VLAVDTDDRIHKQWL